MDKILIKFGQSDKMWILNNEGMTYMTLEEMRARKRELGYTYDKIAELSGLPVGTVQKVFLEITKSPRYDTLMALEKVLKPKQSYMVRETSAYQVEVKQGRYTVEDYLRLPEEERVELIDGIIYDMAAPTDKHQMIVGEIFAKFREYIRKNKGKCVAMMSPLDVQLDCDDKTMVQPDIVIVCDRNKFKEGRVFGAPDLVVEVLSESTKKKDIVIKGEKYSAAGVREYWLVDPKKKRVYVYCYEQEEFLPTMYTFEQKVPVEIWKEECEVDFAEIYDHMSFLYEE